MTKTLRPDAYPSPVDLPFNHASLDNSFQPASPDQDPGGVGVWLPLQGMNLLTITTTQGQNLATGDSPFLTATSPPLYIGQWQGQPCRLLHIQEGMELPPELSKQPLRATEPEIPVGLLSLAGMGQMILHWEKGSQYCGNCGKRMIRLEKEWGKECQTCNTHHFPRIHPCVIGLIIKGD